MVSFYLIGHNYEFEIKNVYKIFDLNSEIKIFFNDEAFNDSADISIVSKLKEDLNSIVADAYLYKDGKLIDSSTINSSNIVIEKDDLKKLKKTIVKKAIYNILSRYFNEKAVYGFLTGIRPNKILTIALKNGMTREKANSILKNTYEVSDEKIKLLNEIYDKQEKYICDEESMNIYNLYIGIPFCPSRCIYCSFLSFINYKDNVLDEYVKTLIYEIEETIKIALNKGLKLNTIYVGGGTPSVLSIENINDIFSAIAKYYDLSKVNEITFEAGRPDTITEEKLKCLKENHVGRISINPQTMNQQTLDKISRKHTIEDIVDVYNLAREIGFNSINMDLIIGLPDETCEDVLNSIDKVIKLRPNNITVHALSFKKGSKLLNDSKELSKDTYNVEKMYEITKDKCNNSGYMPYYMYRQKNTKGNLENIGYALDGDESIYNIVIIEEVETILACGAGAVSKILKGNNRHERVQNYKDLKEYNTNVKKNIVEKFNIISE